MVYWPVQLRSVYELTQFLQIRRRHRYYQTMLLSLSEIVHTVIRKIDTVTLRGSAVCVRKRTTCSCMEQFCTAAYFSEFGSDLRQIWEGDTLIIAFPSRRLDFRYITV